MARAAFNNEAESSALKRKTAGGSGCFNTRQSLDTLLGLPRKLSNVCGTVVAAAGERRFHRKDAAANHTNQTPHCLLRLDIKILIDISLFRGFTLGYQDIKLLL